MYIFAYAMILLGFVCSLGGGLLALLLLWQGNDHPRACRGIEWAQHLGFAALLLASALLLHALFWNDFSLQYVAGYTDRVLHVFYRLTAFWAGQAGSMLFWALMVSLCGSVFVLTRGYRGLRTVTRLWFWVFFCSIMAFFGMVLAGWSNPFLMQTPVPPDGNGLNPLLQNPGMIFHPPLLFLGYGGFVIPGCLALAQCLAPAGEAREEAWVTLARPFTLLAWLFLTAGIVLGMWWAYMELGWGGYWAWDPVENASLVPWLIGTAALHTSILQARRNKLARANAFLMALTTVSAFFATYLVRSGVVESVHAFGDGGVGTPLLLFVLAGLVVSAWAAWLGPRTGNALEGLDSREGFVVLTAWILLLLAAIICTATLWPLISKLWGAQAQGLDANFYNRVCLPLFTVIACLLMACPWLGWNGGVRDWPRLAIVLGSFASAGVAFWLLGYNQPTAFIAAAAAVAGLTSIALLFMDGRIRAHMPTVGAFGTHLGVVLMVLGVAFSGPYKIDEDLLLGKGDTGQAGAYSVRLVDLAEGRGLDYDYIEARLEVRKNDVLIGLLAPQRRMYDKFGNNQFSEVDTLFSFGNEVYASLLGLDRQQRVTVKLSVHPLVNWLWVGGLLMCLFPFVGAWPQRRPTPGPRA